MNEPRNQGRSVTEGLPVRYELIDKDGNSAGIWPSATHAAEAARARWPDQEQDEERTGKGWDISIVGAE